MTAAASPPQSLPAAARVSRWRAPDGWEHRRLDWEADGPARGRVLFLGGRADVFEKYLETLAHLHGRGWSATSFDWRGQGGSGRLAADATVGHAGDFAVLVDDLAAFWAEWAKEGAGDAAGPAVLVGHSMGGHMALRALLDARVDPAAVVLSAPMIAVKSPIGAWAGLRLARALAARGPERPAWKWEETPRAALRRNRRLTTVSDRGQDDRWWLAATPELHLGAPSWGWIAEAFAGGAVLEADPRLATLATPVLLLVAEADKLVDARATLRLATKLPRAEVVRFGPESEHEILRETAAVQARAFAAIDDFLARQAPA